MGAAQIGPGGGLGMRRTQQIGRVVADHGGHIVHLVYLGAQAAQCLLAVQHGACGLHAQQQHACGARQAHIRSQARGQVLPVHRGLGQAQCRQGLMAGALHAGNPDMGAVVQAQRTQHVVEQLAGVAFQWRAGVGAFADDQPGVVRTAACGRRVGLHRRGDAPGGVLYGIFWGLCHCRRRCGGWACRCCRRHWLWCGSRGRDSGCGGCGGSFHEPYVETRTFTDIVTLTEDNFQTEVLDDPGLIIIDFWAEWCQPCKMMAPVFAELNGEEDKVKFCKVNVDEQPNLASMFGIDSIPTLAVVQDRHTLTGMVGVHDKANIKAMLEKCKA